jgi:hypothetical protein
MPYITLLTSWLIPKIKRSLDRGCSGNKWKTKKTGMAAYKNLYSGPEYVIHFKFSGVLNVTYITCMYGLGMPLLFPLAALNMMNQWICERLIVAYIVRLPPALDDTLTKNFIRLLKWAPFLLLANGFWMIGNK